MMKNIAGMPIGLTNNRAMYRRGVDPQQEYSGALKGARNRADTGDSETHCGSCKQNASDKARSDRLTTLHVCFLSSPCVQDSSFESLAKKVPISIADDVYRGASEALIASAQSARAAGDDSTANKLTERATFLFNAISEEGLAKIPEADALPFYSMRGVLSRGKVTGSSHESRL